MSSKGSVFLSVQRYEYIIAYNIRNYPIQVADAQSLDVGGKNSTGRFKYEVKIQEGKEGKCIFYLRTPH